MVRQQEGITKLKPKSELTTIRMKNDNGFMMERPTDDRKRRRASGFSRTEARA